ncbi:MAG: hypothetical protein RLZ35_33 [Pseudomonadota bacterium]|jgi:aminoglycoside/choline kinase family phosphotransferase
MHNLVSSASYLENWLAKIFGHHHFTVMPITGDASFRAYYRVQLKNTSFVVLISPPGESLDPFLQIRKILEDIGLSVPMLFVEDQKAGLLLLSDLGAKQYGDALTKQHHVNQLYHQAFFPLLWMQRYLTPNNCPINIPAFSPDFMLQQLDLFKRWYSEKHLQRRLSSDAEQALDKIFKDIVSVIETQPIVFSHMDYHSRNLMVINKKCMPGVLDFQDAMWAPCTLDLVSLLKDCYVYWPREQVIQWVRQFYDLKCSEKENRLTVDFHTFLKWFDWMGVQRHLRILGTFSRLHHLHKKSAYLQYIPRILSYILDMSHTYPELRPLQTYLK